MKQNKFRNRKTNGYDSKKEYERSLYLKDLAYKGHIYGLQEQYKFELIPAQWGYMDGKKICLERPIIYTADFVYYDRDNNFMVEDVKTEITKTPEYIIKRKLMLYIKDIIIKEVL